MPKVQVTSQIVDLDEVLEGVARLETRDLEHFAEQVLALRAQRLAPNLSAAESELLQKIAAGVPHHLRSRYGELNEKLHEESITPAEYQELLDLIDQLELADAERMGHLVTLAQLRGVSLDALMDQLGIHNPSADG